KKAMRKLMTGPLVVACDHALERRNRLALPHDGRRYVWPRSCVGHCGRAHPPRRGHSEWSGCGDTSRLCLAPLNSLRREKKDLQHRARGCKREECRKPWLQKDESWEFHVVSQHKGDGA